MLNAEGDGVLDHLDLKAFFAAGGRVWVGIGGSLKRMTNEKDPNDRRGRGTGKGGTKQHARMTTSEAARKQSTKD